MTAAAPCETVRSTPFNTAFMLVLMGLSLAMFGVGGIVGLIGLAPGVRSTAPSALLTVGLVFIADLWVCSFFTAYLLSACLFYVRLDGDDLTYRTGFSRRLVSRGAITTISVVDSLKGWRYIVIRSAGGFDTLTNMLWSDKAFEGLLDHIKTWSGSGGHDIPITASDTYSYSTAREFWFGKGNLPRYYQSRIPFTAAVYALIFGAALVIGMLQPDRLPLGSAREAHPRVYPSQAQRANVGGLARMQCRVTASGTLENCTVLSESPPGYGFGQAALKMAPLFQMRPKTRDGKSVTGATVIVPVRFRMPPKNGSAAPARPAS